MNFWSHFLLSIIFWNMAFFGNHLTGWFVIPSIIFWVMIISSLSSPKAEISWYHPFIVGTLWGAICLVPQFWWLARAAHLYPDCYGLEQGYGFWAFFLVLFSVTHAIFTTLQVYLCGLFHNLPWSKSIRIVVASSTLALYFFYLANFCFAPLGEVKGYPFFWPFLPLAKSDAFLKRLGKLQSNTGIAKNLKKFKFAQLDPSKCAKMDSKTQPSSFVGQKIREALKCEAEKTKGCKETIVFLAPEGAFSHPLNVKTGYIDIWSYHMPEESHFLLGTRRQIAPETFSSHNWMQRLMVDENKQIVATGCCQAVGWIHNNKLAGLIDKKTLCPFTEAGILKGENPNYDRVDIGPIKLVPIVCYDFFSNFSWMKTLNKKDEVAVLLTNETWFPDQTSELIRCFVRFCSAWYGKPIVYVSAKYGLELVSYNNAFQTG